MFKGKRGGQLGMGILVGAMDIATANNTVAIVMSKSNCQRNGTDIWNYTEENSIIAGHIFMYNTGGFCLMEHRCLLQSRQLRNWEKYLGI